jgi:uncharacterized protein (TIGR01777 family)
MKILITGGTGLIGSALVDAFIDEHSITLLTRQYDLVKPHNRVSYIHDLNDIDFSNLDVVINLAGERIVNKRWSDRQKDVLCNSRWDITQALVNHIDAVSDKKKIRFISGSAVGFYGRQFNMPITEEHEHTYPEFSHMLCQRWEQIAQSSTSTNPALLRTGIVLSHKGGALSKMLTPFKLGLGGPIASGEQIMPWIHIDDMVGAIQFIIEHETLQGPFNLTAPTPVSNKKFSKTLANALKRPCLLPMPEFVLRLAMGEMADLLVYGQNAVPQALEQAGYQFKYPTIEPAMVDVVSKL